jgi:hypothetical protein
MSDVKPADPILLNAVRQLAADARRAAALLPVDSPEHDFYAGVQHAAQRRTQPGLVALGLPDLDRRSRAFRDGYLATQTEIAIAASGPSPLRLRLPTFRRPAALRGPR